MKTETVLMVVAVGVLAFVAWKTLKRPSLHRDPWALSMEERENMGLYGV